MQILQDVSEEHARKTITVDPHPHLSITAASIHPCRHAGVPHAFILGSAHPQLIHFVFI